MKTIFANTGVFKISWVNSALKTVFVLTGMFKIVYINIISHPWILETGKWNMSGVWKMDAKWKMQ